MPQYLLRTIPPTLWRRVKQKAKQDGHSLRWVLIHLLEGYVKS